MNYKYLAWINDRGDWQGHQLLSDPQRVSVIEALDWKQEIHQSFANYDKQGDITSYLIAFDLDNKDWDQVLFDTQTVVYALESIDVPSWVFYSGNKGFHIIVPYVVMAGLHSLRCVRYIAGEFGHNPSMDFGIYGSRSLLRLNGSPASTQGCYKVPVSRVELFAARTKHGISKMARAPREVKREPVSKDRLDENSDLQSLIAGGVRYSKSELARFKEHFATDKLVVDEHITPCLKRLLTEPVLEGNRNTTVFILARFLKICGMSFDEAYTFIMQFKHMKQLQEDTYEISKVFTHVFDFGKKRKSFLGCKGGGSDAILMRELCHETCHFRDGIKRGTTNIGPQTR